MINISITVDYEAIGKLIQFVNGFKPDAQATTPGPAPEKQTRGRKPKEAPAAEPATPVATPPPAPATAPESKIPTDKEVQDALVAVNDKFGIDKAIECLNKFSVKRGRELRDDQKAAFVELCKSLLG